VQKLVCQLKGTARTYLNTEYWGKCSNRGKQRESWRENFREDYRNRGS